MLLNVAYAALLIAQPLGRVVSTQFLDERRRRSGDVPRELYGVDALEDDVVGLHGVRAREGRGA